MSHIEVARNDAPVRRRDLIVAILLCFIVDLIGTITSFFVANRFDGMSMQEARERYRLEIIEATPPPFAADIAFGVTLACFSVIAGWLAFRRSPPRYAPMVALVATLVITIPLLVMPTFLGWQLIWHNLTWHRFGACIIATATAVLLVVRNPTSSTPV